MTGLPLLVHVLNPERRASGAQGEESSSLTVDNYLVTDDFGIVRRKALATIPLAPSNPLSTTSDGAGEYEHNYSNTFVGSLCNAVTDANHVTSAPAEQSGIESVTGFWRSLCHGESFNVPLDDHVSPISPTSLLSLYCALLYHFVFCRATSSPVCPTICVNRGRRERCSYAFKSRDRNLR